MSLEDRDTSKGRQVARLVLLGSLIGLVLGLGLILLLEPDADRPRIERLSAAVTDLDARPVFADGSEPTTWRVAGFRDPAGFIGWLRRFQGWVAAGERERVVACVDFPTHSLKTAAELRAAYDVYFSDAVRKAVAAIDVGEIWRNYKGAMIEHGTLWFRETDRGYRIVAINPSAARAP